MFYYFSKDINSADEGADRDNPYHCDVQLHRIVTRTDFFFEELPVWEGLTTEDEPATALLRDGEVDGKKMVREIMKNKMVMSRKKKVLVMMKLEQEIQKMKEEQQKTNLLLLYL